MRQLIVPQKQNTPTNDVSSSHQSGDGRQPVVLQTHDTPTQDVSAGSPQAESLESMIDVGASLPPKQHPGGIRALIAEKKRLNKEWKANQKATTATVAKRPAPASEDRPNKRLQARGVTGLGELPDAGVDPNPFNITHHDIRSRPCFAKVNFPDSRGTITFGSAFRQSRGTAAKVRVLPGKWGDPSVTLKMSVNKNGLNEDLASGEDEISTLKMVWQPYQVQEFAYGLVSESQHLQHPSVEEQAKLAGKDSSLLIYVRMVTNSSQITNPHEAEYWRLLTRKGEAAARNMAICAGFMAKTERDNNVTVEFWFRNGFSTSTWVSLVGSSFKRCVDERFLGRQHYQGPDRMPVPEYQGENRALEVRPVDSREGARPEPTPFRPGDKVVKLVREGWSIMEAIGKVFGEATSDSVEPPGQSEAAAQDAANVESSNPFLLSFGDEAKGEVSEIAQTSREAAIEPKTTPGEASLNPAPEQEEESDDQLQARFDALVDQGWTIEAAMNEVYLKLLPAEEKPQKKESGDELDARADALIDQGWSFDDAFEEVFGKQEQAKEKPQ